MDPLTPNCPTIRKVFFVANYAYLNLPTYEQIIRDLEGCIEPWILEVPGSSGAHAEAHYSDGYFPARGIQRICADVRPIPHSGIFEKIHSICASLDNYHSMSRLLKQEKPDVVVVGSDLGNLNIRFLLEHCRLLEIRVVILYLCDVPPENRKAFMYLTCRLMDRVLLGPARYLRALIFSGQVVGTYATQSPVFVISETIRQKLIGKGIEGSRIRLYGFPGGKEPPATGLRERYNIPEGCRVVVFFTECLQDIYGEEYVRTLYTDLGAMSRSLQAHEAILIVKPHPLEPEHIIHMLEEQFGHPGSRVIANGCADDLIFLSDVSVAHYSRVLIEACLAGKNIISINIKRDPSRSFLSEWEAACLECVSIGELEGRILDLLSNNEASCRAGGAVRSVARRYSSGDDNSVLYSLIAGTD